MILPIHDIATYSVLLTSVKDLHLLVQCQRNQYCQSFRTLSSRASKAAGATNTFLQIGNLDDLRGVYSLEHKLCDTIATLDRKVVRGVIEEQYLHFSTIV